MEPKTAIRKIDSRGRINLSGFAKAGDLFIIKTEDNLIILEPASVVPLSQLQQS